MRKLLLAAAVLTGCAPPGVGDAYVLLGREARLAGYALEGGRAPILPVMVDPAGPPPLLVHRGAETVLPIEAGALTWIRGWDGVPEVAVIDADVRADRLELRGSPFAAGALAELLEATLDPISGDRFALTSLDLLVHSADLDAPEGIEEVVPISTKPDPAAAAAPIAGGPVSFDAPALVGVYGTDGARTRLILDASGGFTLSLAGRCGDRFEITGTYQAEGARVRLAARDGEAFELALGAEGVLDGPRGRFTPEADPDPRPTRPIHLDGETEDDQ